MLYALEDMPESKVRVRLFRMSLRNLLKLGKM